ncbi:Ubiquitin carboxyl-terminal hydrolase 7 [Paragonimus heterotremus]|uniref:Ubiquitin carboxyl-terminal hydrolase 7 n=1 Tax=Paragonimus heterotremus TaxID=100268 RepID=A0A8J4TH60_9TREM|nr:Ubiquitin carboxyl-terminal hydrolase 7 [Paragonimus heterotremus]
MSQNKPGKLSPATPKNTMSPLNRNGGQRTLENEEAMEVEQTGYTQDMPADDVEDDRFRAWLSANVGVHNPPSTEAHCEQTGDMMEDYDDEDEASATGLVEARFENVSRYKLPHCKTDTRTCGGGTMIRCLPWKILVIFHPPESGSLGFFVQCNADSDSQTWSCSAKATLILVAQRPNCKNKEMKIQHTFTHKENDWGFQSFISYEELFNPERGFISPTDDSILLQARVKADAPHGADWDSKRHTGFVGLKNQGATCYLNSLLQALYCTNKLRRAVFLMPTESDDAQTSVPLALQRVFYELQFSDRAVGTKKLTRSFGWATLDSFMQHDAQELCRVLLDNLENKMKGTSVEDVIPGLFCGKMLSYIRCLNVPYESKREENFYDIQLKVNGNRTIYEAFAEYVAKETLTQDNKYDAGEYGLQEAEKGVSFIRFPPVLYLQLMRFQYDFVADTNVKINDRFEFMYTLHLDNFLLHPDPGNPTTYFLHAVLVHSGDNHGGHYVVYINPAGNGVWYQFDDDVVSRCSARDAIYMNFGGTEDPEMRPCTNAYMLVYIAESARADVLCPVSRCDIPESLRERFIEEQNLEEAKRLDKERGHLYMVIYLLLEEDFYGWQGPELCCQEQLPSRMLRVPKQTTRTQLVEAVAKSLNHPTESIRLWHFRPRRKNIPIHLVELNDNPLQYTPKDIHIFFVQCCSTSSTSMLNSSTFLRFGSSNAPESEHASDKRLFFVKFFDPFAWSMTFCGHVELSGDECLSALEPVLRERAGLPVNCPLILYQDDPKMTVSEILQLRVPISKLYKREHQGLLIYFQVKQPQTQLPPALSILASAEFGKETVNSSSEETGIAASGITDTIESTDGTTVKPSSTTEAVNGIQVNRRLLCDTGSNKLMTNVIDPIVLHRMAALPITLNAKCLSPTISPGSVTKPVSPTLHSHAMVPGDSLSIQSYVASHIHQVDILLVDKLRPLDSGILLRVAADLTYWEFANVAAAHLSTTNDRLQFFRSQQILGGAANTVTAPISVSPLGTTTTELNASPVGSDLSAGVVASNTGVSADNSGPGLTTLGTNVTLDSALSPQAIAARASGFPNTSAYMNNLLTAAATQGLAQEPPGAAIPSTHPGSMQDFFLPFSVSPANSAWVSEASGLGAGFVTSGTNLASATAAGTPGLPDRFPAPLNRYCGVKTVARSPFGPVTFPPPRRVYYAHLAIRIDELETMRQVRVVYVGPKLSTKAELLLSVPQSGLVMDLLKEASRHLSLLPDGSGQLRLFEVSANRIIQEFPSNLKLSSITQSTLLPQTCVANPPVHSLRIEEIPLDELNLKPDETVVYVSHFDKELHETFGIPFTVRIRDGEHYSAVRERIRRRLEVPEKEFERWRFLVMSPSDATYIPNDEDTVVRTKVFTQPCAPEYRPWLGIEHKPSKRPRYAPNEKPIKIHN